MATYQQKLVQAVKDWIAFNPNSGLTEEEIFSHIAKNNRARWPEACDEFDYSGTIWCDRCGHEAGNHLVSGV